MYHFSNKYSVKLIYGNEKVGFLPCLRAKVVALEKAADGVAWSEALHLDSK